MWLGCEDRAWVKRVREIEKGMVCVGDDQSAFILT